MRILVADDSYVVRQRLVSLLTAVGSTIDVREARSAAEALATACSDVPTMIVLDVRLPDRSGFEIIPHLKALVPSPLVVVLTTHAGLQYASESRRRGADYFLDKSNEFERVAQILRELLLRPDRTA